MIMATDPNRVKSSDPGNPEVCPVWQHFWSKISDQWARHDVSEKCTTASWRCVDCKRRLLIEMEDA